MDDLSSYFQHWSAKDHKPKPREENQPLSSASIPARVTMGRFIALAHHLNYDQSARQLKTVPYFGQKLQRNHEADLKYVRRLLYNSWNTEYLLRASEQQSDDYLRIALHWSFPQAYYCVYLNLHAFLVAKGINAKTHEGILRQFGSLVRHGAYPKAMSFHLMGELSEPSFVHLPHYNPALAKTTVELSPIRNIEEADTSIAGFLRTTRREKAELLKAERQSRKRNALKTKDGRVRQSFQREHWKVITDRMGITTILDLLYRLRIKANYQDIDSFIQDRIDCRPFYTALREIIAYLNFVHESYTAKVIGVQQFERIVEDFPGKAEQQFVQNRLQRQIRPLF